MSGVLGPVLEPLEGIWGACWDALGAVLGALGVGSGPLGVLLGHPEALLRVMSGSLGTEIEL